MKSIFHGNSWISYDKQIQCHICTISQKILHTIIQTEFPIPSIFLISEWLSISRCHSILSGCIINYHIYLGLNYFSIINVCELSWIIEDFTHDYHYRYAIKRLRCLTCTDQDSSSPSTIGEKKNIGRNQRNNGLFFPDDSQYWSIILFELINN